MGMSSGGKGDELNSEINVTPMVDVMLVLLIIFMITAPMMNTGVEIDLPQVTASNIEDPEGPLLLSIDIHQKITLGAAGSGTPVTWQDLEVKLKANEVAKSKGIYIAADAKLPYQVVVTAMAIARNAKVSKLMMLTDPTEILGVKELDQTGAP